MQSFKIEEQRKKDKKKVEPKDMLVTHFLRKVQLILKIGS
jgi:hypothetical protein